MKKYNTYIYNSKLTLEELENLMVRVFSSVIPIPKSKIREMLKNYRKSIEMEMINKFDKEFKKWFNKGYLPVEDWRKQLVNSLK